MDLQHHVGLNPDGTVWLPDRRAAAGSILLKLAAVGIEIPGESAGILPPVSGSSVIFVGQLTRFR